MLYSFGSNGNGQLSLSHLDDVHIPTPCTHHVSFPTTTPPHTIAAGGNLLHMLNHAVTKALLFFVAGTLGQRYGTLQMLRMRGAAQAAPLAGTLLLLVAFAITGTASSAAAAAVGPMSWPVLLTAVAAAAAAVTLLRFLR